MAIKGKRKVKRLAQSLGITLIEARAFVDRVNSILGELGFAAATVGDITKAIGTWPAPDRSPENVVIALLLDDAEATDAPADAGHKPNVREVSPLTSSNPTQAPEKLPQDDFADAAQKRSQMIARASQHGSPQIEVPGRTNASPQRSPHGPIDGNSMSVDEWEEAKANAQECTLQPEPDTESEWPRAGIPSNSSVQSDQLLTTPSRLNSRPSDGQASWWYRQQKNAPRPTGTQPIDSHVAGVSFEGRQRTVALLVVGEKLWLRRERHNPHDSNAIRVVRLDEAQIGYIPRVVAAIIAPFFDRSGQPVQAEVTAILGKGYPDRHLGVRIRFLTPESTPAVLPRFDDIWRDSNR